MLCFIFLWLDHHNLFVQVPETFKAVRRWEGTLEDDMEVDKSDKGEEGNWHVATQSEEQLFAILNVISHANHIAMCQEHRSEAPEIVQGKNRPLDSMMRESFDTAQEKMQDPAGSGTVAFL